jgi:hypothetical protein
LATIDDALAQVKAGGNVFKGVRGEYGSGKTFFARWLEERAKRGGFAASEVQISEATPRCIAYPPLHRTLGIPRGHPSARPVQQRDNFITLALSAAEDPGWVAQVCGTSEQMIFRHYRRWIPSQVRPDGRRIAALYRRPAKRRTDPNGHPMGTGAPASRGNH